MLEKDKCKDCMFCVFKKRPDALVLSRIHKTYCVYPEVNKKYLKDNDECEFFIPDKFVLK